MFGVIEIAEMLGGLGVRHRTEMLFLCIPPNECVGQRIVRKNRQQYPIPPGRIRHIDEATFGECHWFVMLFTEGAKHVEVGTRLTNELFFRAPLIGIESDEVNALIPRIPLEEFIFSQGSV